MIGSAPSLMLQCVQMLLWKWLEGNTSTHITLALQLGSHIE